jgi:hypothetical protein
MTPFSSPLFFWVSDRTEEVIQLAIDEPGVLVHEL